MSETKHSRSRNVPHPTGARVRGLVAETNSRRVARTAGTAPRRPAVCALYDDVADPPDVAAPVFGQYPASLIPKILPWLRCERHEILHVCSGALPQGEGIRVDIRPAARPDILADGRKLPLATGSVAAVMLDPPYTEHYALDLYGVDYPRPSHLLREAARVVRPCGRIAFVHYITPNPPPGCEVVKVFGLSTGFGFPMRAITVYERSQAGLELVTPAVTLTREESGT